jgi:peptidyl-prolyl cis-trans isomerase D
VGDLTSVEAGDAAWVVRLDKIVPADPKDPDVEKLKARLAATAAQGIESDGFNMFATALMSKTKVSLDQAAIAAVNAQFH